jgi:hypothetical protein
VRGGRPGEDCGDLGLFVTGEEHDETGEPSGHHVDLACPVEGADRVVEPDAALFDAAVGHLELGPTRTPGVPGQPL